MDFNPEYVCEDVPQHHLWSQHGCPVSCINRVKWESTHSLSPLPCAQCSVCLFCTAEPQCSTHGPDRGRVQECREWADHTACALLPRRVLDLFLRLEGWGRTQGNNSSHGRELWDTNTGDILEPQQECWSRPRHPLWEASEYLSATGEREKERKPPTVPSHVQKMTTWDSFYDFCNLCEWLQMQPSAWEVSRL